MISTETAASGGTDRSQILSCPPQSVPTSPTCDPMDTDGDGDVDLEDYIGILESVTASGACDPPNGRVRRTRTATTSTFASDGFFGAAVDIRLGRLPVLCGESFFTNQGASNAFVAILDRAPRSPRHVQIGFTRARGYVGLPAAPQTVNAIYTEFRARNLPAEPENTPWYDRRYFAPAPSAADNLNYGVQRAGVLFPLQGRFEYSINGGVFYTFESSDMDFVVMGAASFETETYQSNTRVSGSSSFRCQFTNCEVSIGDFGPYLPADLATPRAIPRNFFNATTLPTEPSTALVSNSFDVWDIR